MALVEPLTIDIQAEGSGSIRLALQGDLDLATAPVLAQRIAVACQANPAEILLDFTGVTFCDSSGIRECILASEKCAASGIKMKMLGAGEQVSRVFEIVGLSDRFEWADT
jgi:anti-sigma B factor antagonist